MGCCAAGGAKEPPPGGARTALRPIPAAAVPGSPGVQGKPDIRFEADDLVEQVDTSDLHTCVGDEEYDEPEEGTHLVSDNRSMCITRHRSMMIAGKVTGDNFSGLSGAASPTRWSPPPRQLAASVTAAPCKHLFITDITSDFCKSQKNVDALKRGDALFAIVCTPGQKLSVAEKHMLAQVLNPTCFADEGVDNNIPKVSMESNSDLAAHIFVLQRSMYVLPGPLTSKDIDLGTLSSADFRKKTEPGKPKIWDDEYVRSQVNTYRMTKEIIPWIYKLTIQFRLSEITDQAQKQTISQHLIGGLRPDRVILFERTKRDKSKTDSMKKMKMIHVYHDLPDGGVLLTCVGALTLSSLPKVLAPLVSKIAQLSGEDYAQTATNIRTELLRLHAAGQLGKG